MRFHGVISILGGRTNEDVSLVGLVPERGYISKKRTLLKDMRDKFTTLHSNPVGAARLVRPCRRRTVC